MLTDSHLGRGAAASSVVYSRSPLSLSAPRGGSGRAGSAPRVAESDTPPGGVVSDVQVTALDGTVGATAAPELALSDHRALVVEI